MINTFTLNLAKPFKSVKIIDDSSFTDNMNRTFDKDKLRLIQELEAQKKLCEEAYLALQTLTAKLSQFYEEVFANHKKEIAGLSIEIARRILTQKITDGDYQIESIILEALKNAPARQDLVVHLNPHDITACQEIISDNHDSLLAGIALVADQNIGRAECLLESPKGIIKSLVNEHLEQIAKALNEVN